MVRAEYIAYSHTTRLVSVIGLHSRKIIGYALVRKITNNYLKFTIRKCK